MQKYFTHARSGDSYATDEEGELFASLADARKSAVTGVRQLIADQLLSGASRIEISVFIDDHVGERQATIPISVVATGLDA